MRRLCDGWVYNTIYIFVGICLLLFIDIYWTFRHLGVGVSKKTVFPTSLGCCLFQTNFEINRFLQDERDVKYFLKDDQNSLHL